MLIFKLFTIYVYVQTLLCGCGPDRREGGFEGRRSEYQVRRMARMPREVTESSGLVRAADGHLWTHNDSGHENRLFKVDMEGKLLETFRVPGASNVDWEDLARDSSGYLYIGDFGNNANNRRDLRIYRVNEQERMPADTIGFSYAGQNVFPPAKTQHNFDAEAFFWHKDRLFLFSKNRWVRAPTIVYELPATPGTYLARPSDTLLLRAMITGADISPDRKKIALLGYGKLYLFEAADSLDLFRGRRVCIPIARSGQAEAVVFLPNNDIIFSNEGGKIFQVRKKDQRKE